MIFFANVWKLSCKICLAVSSRDTKGHRNSTVFSHKRVNTIGLIIPYSVYTLSDSLRSALIKLPNYLLDLVSRYISSVKVKSPTERIRRKQPFHFAVCAHARNCVVKANLYGSFSARCEMNASSERVFIRTHRRKWIARPSSASSINFCDLAKKNQNKNFIR